MGKGGASMGACCPLGGGHVEGEGGGLSGGAGWGAFLCHKENFDKSSARHS